MKLHFSIVDKKQCSHHYSYHVIKEAVSADRKFNYISFALDVEIIYSSYCAHLVGIGGAE